MLSLHMVFLLLEVFYWMNWLIILGLPSLETITFGMYALDFLEELTIEGIINEVFITTIDLPNLQSLIFGFDACEGTCQSSKLTLKGLPCILLVIVRLTFTCYNFIRWFNF